MTQIPTKIIKKIEKDPEFKKQIDSMNKSFRNFSQNYKNQTDSIFSDEQIRKISEEANEACLPLIEETEKNKTNKTKFELEVLDSGIFKYKGKILSITTKSDPGIFLKQLIKNSNHFVPDTFCFEKFKTPSPNETRGIIQKIKNKLKKDNLTIECRRVGDPSGYVLTEVLEIQSQIGHK